MEDLKKKVILIDVIYVINIICIFIYSLFSWRFLIIKKWELASTHSFPLNENKVAPGFPPGAFGTFS